ncbi:MAG: CotH kinase family protein, partial [Lachnospiraceae bacterium]|nr:CotH kinase family protein [Lachnospiraceae bacterium]
MKINEVCTSNIHAFITEDGEHPDYVEIYNGEDREIDLTGWKLSDNRNNENVWTFPEVSVGARSYLLISLNGGGDDPLSVSFTLPSKGSELFLSDPHNSLMDSIEIPELKYDTVYGRSEDGAGLFKILSPTPGSGNASAEERVFPSLKEPVFSADSGFYGDSLTLSISSPDGAEVRYTLDGSEPDRNSPLYSGPITLSDASDKENVYSVIRDSSVFYYDYYNIRDYRMPEDKLDKCNVIRAKAFSDRGEESETVTKSFFLGFDDKEMYEGIGIVSLVADPDDLFGSEKGIYVLGDMGREALQRRYKKNEEAAALIAADPTLPLDGSVKIGKVGFNRNSEGNYTQHGIGWEREADITYFNEDHDDIILQQSVGIRVKGNSSRQYPMKGFNIYARNAYSGKDYFDAPLFDGRNKISRIALSAGGNDRYTLTKDPFFSERIRETGLDVASGRFGKPLYLFLNGEFWGTCVMSERLEEDFFSSEYGVDPDNVIFIKEGEVEAGRKEDIHYYFAFLDLYEGRDFCDEEQYREFCDAVDMDSLMDYYSIRVFAEYGMDWPHLNYGYWRTRDPEEGPYGDCKWRFVNFDNNISLDYEKIDVDMFDVLFNGSDIIGPDELFTALWENQDFRIAFG